MSRFYMTGVNSRGNTVSAAGSSRGQDVHLRGWRVGVEVVGRPKPLDPKRDCFDVYATHGSSPLSGRMILGTLQETSDGDLIFTLSDELAGKMNPAYQSATVA